MKAVLQRKPLAAVADVFDGPHATPKTVDAGPIFLGISALHDGVIKLEDTRHVTEDDYELWTRRVKPRANDIVFSYETRLGQAAIVPDGLRCCLGRRMGLVRFRDDTVLPRYFMYQYISPQFRTFLESKTIRGATVDRLSIKEFPTFEIVVPSQAEQHRIVGILDEAFEGIAAAKANAEKNLANARAVFESYLARVFAERGNGWRSSTLEEVVDADCTLSYGIVQPGEAVLNGLPVVRPTDLTTKIITAEGLKRIDPTLAEGYRRTTLRGGELVICVRGSTGVVSVIAPDLAGANVTRGIVPVMFEPSLLRQDFGYFLMSSDSVQGQIRAKTYGAALMQINIGDLKKVEVSFPELNEQSAIAARLETLSTDTKRLEVIYESKLATLDELKQSLLREAFSGRL